jgi:hypothetical protein
MRAEKKKRLHDFQDSNTYFVEDEASCEWPLTSTKNENAEKL